MKHKQAVYFLIMLVSFCFSTFAQIEKSNNDSLTDTKVELFENESKLKLGVEWYLQGVFLQAGRPAGIVFDNNEDVYKEFEYQPQILTLTEVLDLFVKSRPEYSWKTINGVINVFPENDYSILSTRISEFKVENEFPWKMDEKLIQTEEFQRYIKEKNLVNKVPDPDNIYGFIFFGGGGRSDPRYKISIDVKNATVREILNEIVRKSETRFWSYHEYDVTLEGKTYHLYKLTS